MLGAWGMKQSAQLQKQVDKLNGDDANLQAPKFLDEGPQLDGRQQAAQGVDTALQLLQEFAMVGCVCTGVLQRMRGRAEAPCTLGKGFVSTPRGMTPAQLRLQLDAWSNGIWQGSSL